jgi:hypothetical protein
MATQSRTIAPQGVDELVLYLALVDSPAAARGYACLGSS